MKPLKTQSPEMELELVQEECQEGVEAEGVVVLDNHERY
jgi:hypothetical protein